jgi:hypothetical protein
MMPDAIRISNSRRLNRRNIFNNEKLPVKPADYF